MIDQERELITLNGATIEARKKEINAIFDDPHLLGCLDVRLPNTGEQLSPAIAKARRSEALKAFSQNDPGFWDMAGSIQAEVKRSES